MRDESVPSPVRGMTLVEVLVALGILVVGMIGVLSLITAAARSQKRAMDEANAAELAETVMAELRAKFESGRVPLGSSAEAKGLVHNGYPDYKYTVRQIPVDHAAARDPRAKGQTPPKEYYVEVEVFWSESGDKRSVVFQTVMLLRTE